MTEAGKKILEAFEALPQSERQEILRELLHRAAFGEHDLPDEDDLVASADRIFQELDRRESRA
jgi:hypothetical protein